MTYLAAAAGMLLVFVVLWETFETMVLPRTIVRQLRLTRIYYRVAWSAYRLGARGGVTGPVRESYLSAFGPLSLLGLLLCWVVSLIFGFALIQWGLGSRVTTAGAPPGLGTDLYMSGITFFTVGFGDVVPITPAAKLCAVIEAGTGLGFLAIVIGYIPVIYASFSRREAGISLLDARAGSPPTACEMLCRHASAGSMEALAPLLATFESWASDLMESHLSYPVVAYYRSQHDRESWISSLAAILDVCAIIAVGFETDAAWLNPLQWQARMTFAMARHALVDLSLVFHVEPETRRVDRLPAEEFEETRAQLAACGLKLAGGADAERRLRAIRDHYEPYLGGLGASLLMSLPPWRSVEATRDNWQTSAWADDSHL
ncbi:MAG TPA: potassium channel family protein [Chthonomonadaceae bacterium]|nr:potassium channel family protein [Chthonomonadaceae bacterium]